MLLFTTEIAAILDENGRLSHPIGGYLEPTDLKPVVRLFTPDANANWLLVSTDPHYPDLAFGLCDLGLGFPEIGHIELGELRLSGWTIQRDFDFIPTKTLREYAQEANQLGKINIGEQQ